MTLEEFVTSEVKTNPEFANGLLDSALAAAGNALTDAQNALAAVQSEAQQAVNAAQAKVDELTNLKSELNPQPLPPVDEAANPTSGEEVTSQG